MSEEMLILYCSPTLAGLKTGNLFTVRMENEEVLLGEVRRINQKLALKGLRVIPMRKMEKKMLIYVYRPQKLKKDFTDPSLLKLLGNMGYPCEKPERCIMYLARRLKENADFPHEIGLFLGYPAEDVQGFMENNARNFKYTGYWKVYGDVEKARRKFAQFKKCTDIYFRQWSEGISIERLTVSL